MNLVNAKRIVLIGVSVSILISIIQWVTGPGFVGMVHSQIFIAILKRIGIVILGLLVIKQSQQELKHFWFLGLIYLIIMPLYFGGLIAYDYLILGYGLGLSYLVFSYAKFVSLLITVPAYIFLVKHISVKPTLTEEANKQGSRWLDAIQVKIIFFLLVSTIASFVIGYLLQDYVFIIYAVLFFWILVFLVLVVFPAEIFTNSKKGFFLLSAIGSLFLAVILVALLSSDSVGYLKHDQNYLYYIWSLKLQIVLVAFFSYGLASLYYFAVLQNKLKNIDGKTQTPHIEL